MSDEFFKWYEHPLWQERRLRIMERDGFRCRRCWSAERMLHVHHAYYKRGAKPWEYEDKELTTLCEQCHKEHQLIMREVQIALSAMDCVDFCDALGAISDVMKRTRKLA